MMLQSIIFYVKKRTQKINKEIELGRNERGAMLTKS